MKALQQQRLAAIAASSQMGPDESSSATEIRRRRRRIHTVQFITSSGHHPFSYNKHMNILNNNPRGSHIQYPRKSLARFRIGIEVDVAVRGQISFLFSAIQTRPDWSSQLAIGLLRTEVSGSQFAAGRFPPNIFDNYWVNRNLDAGHQMFIASCVRTNIGYVRSYKLFREIVGEYSNVGATGVDFKNFKRDLMAYILNGDVQLFIDTLFKRRELCKAFEFEYDVDDVDQLTRVFWADAVSRKNFELFGDIVSFDATYLSNRYNLVFVPFTGIDNYKRSITFGAGLLTREDVNSYLWLLERFKTTMRHEPICVVTDQDPAVKVAVARVFGTSKHRFFMWHIMCKVGEKVGPVLAKDEVFRRKLNGIVWNKSIDSKAFEDSWSRIMEEYGLIDNGQRLDQSLKIVFLAVSLMVIPTPLALEKHAMDVYTIFVFYDVQVEICEGWFSCRVVSLCDCDGKVCYGIKDGDKKAWCVEFLLADSIATCSCKMFEWMELVSRHIFFVFKDRGLERIPSMYLVSRWIKGACLKPIFDIDDTVVDQSAKVDNVRVLTNLMWSEIYAFVGLADDGCEDDNAVAGSSKESVIKSFCGDVSQGSTVEVRDPIKAKNKGSEKRMKSAREKAPNKCVKQSRKCHTCDEYGHNSRMCPLNG
ncbi:PREDICTED: protein FAR1-RELATED SEQUENCE 5-like [Ipomoea nil]|uniref:protein FAR1-RELATED SEQUENCE 5-like n=1 Tax=Ipomoea nil TaxID=35883 RepID=UPI000901EBCC|nr:PREDICTED: protein FAR1-RELATED SEQUENCE 5-like [Ipomoea nil]